MKLQEAVTVADIDKLEHERQGKLKDLTSKAEQLDATRAGIIFQIATGGDKSLLKELDAVEKEQKETAREIEIIETLLAAIDGQRERAHAVEVENDINAIEELNHLLVDRTHKIDAAAEAFVLAVKDYYDILLKLYEINSHAFYSFHGADED